MSEQITLYQICRANGIWRKLPAPAASGHPVNLVAADYEHRFFLMDCFQATDNEIRKAQAQGAEATDFLGITTIRSDDDNLPKLDPALEWTPRKSSSYVKPREAQREQYHYDILDRISGIWESARVGKMRDEFVIFLPNGRGVIEYWDPALERIDEFAWKMIGGERLLIEAAGSSDTPERQNDPLRYFGAAQLTTQIFAATDAYGEKFDLLRLAALQDPNRAMELRRSRRLLGEYRTPKLQDQAE
jgi:hypothetical protein